MAGMSLNEDHSYLRALWIILMVGGFIQASIDDGTIFLERGNPGIVSCPPVASGRIPLGQIDAMYWYFPRVRAENLLISYFLRNVAPQNGIPEGVYDINGNFSLVIENVTDSDEGTYYCRVKPKLRMLVDGQVTKRVKVSPKEPFPDVTQCTERMSETACEAELPNDIKKPMLTCIVRDTKPAVALRWLLEFSDGDTQLISDRFTVQPSEYSVNTYTTSASIPIMASTVYMYRCQTYGEALGTRNGSHVTVTITTAPYTQQKQREHDFTSLGSIPTVTVHSFGEDCTDKDTPDGCQNALIWLIVLSCLSLTTNAGFVIRAVRARYRRGNLHKRNMYSRCHFRYR